eukprot:COSAG04_NODE_3390_length_2865_cov_1.714751_4_plen_99_part_01
MNVHALRSLLAVSRAATGEPASTHTHLLSTQTHTCRRDAEAMAKLTVRAHRRLCNRCFELLKEDAKGAAALTALRGELHADRRHALGHHFKARRGAQLG